MRCPDSLSPRLAMSPVVASVSLPDVSVSRADMAAVRGRLRSYQARYAPFFGRRELRGHARAYLQGLLSDEPRKSIERMVLRLRGADANAVRTQQLFLRQARWDDAPILAAHRELVAATLGEEEGVLAVDGTDLPKDGTESVGVARQYCGQLGKRANCRRRSSRPTWGAGRRPWWTGGCICPGPGSRGRAMRTDAGRPGCRRVRPSAPSRSWPWRCCARWWRRIRCRCAG